MSPDLGAVAIVGATAAGKTGLSLDLATAVNGEIVNTDAMQLYRGMNIGTAKLPEAERRGIRHHLLDLLSVRESSTVADFQALARATIHALQQRRVRPILVGGSALYTRAVLDQFEFPGTDPDVRARIEREVEEQGLPPVQARLQALDPVTAGTIDPANARRIIRALEVIELTGRPYSASLPRLEYAEPGTVQIGVDIDRPTLDARIEQRVAQMFDEGLVAEVERLLDEGLADGITAARAIGYPEVRAMLAGEMTLAQAHERIVIATRRFARRQDGWFRKDPRVHWIRFDDPDRLEKALAVLETAGSPA